MEKHDPWRVVPMSGKIDGLLFMEGNRAAALGCVMGGCTVAAWYPITPSSSLCEYFIAYCDRYRVDPETGNRSVAVVQAEDELAAAGIVFGAGWAGARAMTSTSGPGISLMAEYAGYGYFAEVPGVIFDVQRAGPFDRPADAHDAGRRFVCLYALARRHQAHRAVAGDRCRGVRVCDGGLRSGGTFSDARLRAQRSRSRNERVAHAAAAVSGETIRSRKGAGRRRSGVDEVLGPLPGRRQGRNRISHAAGNEPSCGRILYSRNRPR